MNKSLGKRARRSKRFITVPMTVESQATATRIIIESQQLRENATRLTTAQEVIQNS
jgi:hypothetical protein